MTSHNAQHIFIEGENLVVLKLLYKQYFGRVKLIYIDPPYNTGNDFIYHDNFTDPLDSYLRLTGQKNGNGDYLTSRPEKNGRLHSAWLSMMYPRLTLARQFLRQDGFIVISIDDAELHDLRLMMNDVFGEENFIAVLVWDRNRKNDAKLFSVGHEYMVVYAKNKQMLRDTNVVLRAPKEGIEDVRQEFERLREEYNNDWASISQKLREFFKKMEEDDPRKPLGRFTKVDERGPYRDDGDISWPGGGGPTYDVVHPVTGKPCRVPRRGWVFSTKERMEKEIEQGNVTFGPDENSIPSLKSYLFERTLQVMRSVQFSYAQKATQDFDKIFDEVHVFDNPKNYNDLQSLIDYLTDENDIVFDFFAGSASTGHGVLFSNKVNKTSRRFICVQFPESVNPKTNTGKNALNIGPDSSDT